VERVATTPERFLRALVARTPFDVDVNRLPKTGARPREAYDAALAFLATARGRDGAPAIFLLDEVLEVKTFESFPGLRHALPELLRTMSLSRNRFVLTTRYAARAARLLREEPGTTMVVVMPHLTADELRDALDDEAFGLRVSRHPAHALHAELAPAIHALSEGRPGYVRAVCDVMLAMEREGGGDPVSALAASLGPGGRVAARCGYCYELRLHRARGYGALKAILDILAEEEGLTLTEISLRLGRTPGSTKDYLSWLEDVDLVAVDRKRYRFADPLLRLWVRLYCRPLPPAREDIAREVQCYALARLAEPAPAVEAPPASARTA
jgi:hypothetical protein